MSEHDAVRRAIDSKNLVEGTFLSVLLLTTGAAAPIALKFHQAERRALLFLVASLITSAISWSIELQYWGTLWHQSYIARRLAPAARELVLLHDCDRAILGFEDFKLNRRERPRSMILIMLIGGIFYQLLIVFPAGGFLAAAVVTEVSNKLAWPGYMYPLVGIGSASLVLLGICIFAGYYVANFELNKDREHLS
jgi:hypothetical protein